MCIIIMIIIIMIATAIIIITYPSSAHIYHPPLPHALFLITP